MRRPGACAVTLCVTLSLAASAAPGADNLTDTELLSRGRALYHGAAPITGAIRVGEAALPPAAAVCANCHGARGEGGREAGVEAPAITAQRLLAPSAGRAAYASPQHVLRAIEQGEGRGAVRLLAPMPQYALSASERGALLAYLKVLGSEADQAQGVWPERIVVGSVLPLTGAARADGEHIRGALLSRFDTINRAGGVFGRQVELVVEDSGTNAQTFTQAAQRLIQQHGVFAVVGSLAPEMPAAVRELMRRSGTPFIGTLGVTLADSSERKLTYLLPSVQRQLQQLLGELGQHCDVKQGLLLLHAPAAGLEQTMKSAAEVAAPGVPLQTMTVRNAADVRALPADAKARTVIALLPAATVSAVREQLHTRNAQPCLGTLAMFSGSAALAQGSDAAGANATSGVKEVVGLPMKPVAISTQGQAGGLWGFLADVAASTFAEALARTGRVVDHQGFDRAVDTLHGYEPVAGLPLVYSPRQRHGLAVTHLWKGEAHGN